MRWGLALLTDNSLGRMLMNVSVFFSIPVGMASAIYTTADPIDDPTSFETVIRIIMSPSSLLAVFIVGGLLYMIGELYQVDEIDEPAARSRSISEVADLDPVTSDTLTNLRKRIAFLKTLPDAVVTSDSRIEQARVEESHLPALLDAHAVARSTLTDAAQIARLDADLNRSLLQLSTTLETLIADARGTAKDGFATQQRFVDVRHGRPQTSL